MHKENGVNNRRCFHFHRYDNKEKEKDQGKDKRLRYSAYSKRVLPNVRNKFEHQAIERSRPFSIWFVYAEPKVVRLVD
jgi:hypothetical protein